MPITFALERLNFATFDGHTTTGALVSVHMAEGHPAGPKLLLTVPLPTIGASSASQAAETALRLARQLLQPDQAEALLAQVGQEWDSIPHVASLAIPPRS